MLSVIITTYNWPQALKMVLEALIPQLPAESELLIADDGSTKETRRLIESMQTRFPIQHLWQEDLGFRAARARNLAIKQATGDYCLFLDGDCVPSKHFIKRHLALAESGFFVAGNRVLLSKEWSDALLSGKEHLPRSGISGFALKRLQGKMNRLLPLISLPNSSFRHKKGFRWKGAKTCNLAVWREDLLKVNGFDESFLGWGYEDSELIIRLLNSGVGHKSGRYSVPVFHLWHTDASRENQARNLHLLEERIKKKAIVAQQGL